MEMGGDFVLDIHLKPAGLVIQREVKMNGAEDTFLLGGQILGQVT